MIKEDLENRQLIIDQTRREDERSDLKQHADKMLRDFEKFNDFSSNRAIWELVQNACDLTTHCEILIDYRENKLSFTHNGKPFDTKSLISLIKQVSGKYGNQEDIPEVGKYGTGFLTTHTFGRKFIINSFLDTGSYFIPIKNFEVDRSPKTWELLSDKISDQKKRVYDILKNESSVEHPGGKTTFTYLPESPKEFEYIKKSINDLDDYIPLVFTINDRLKKVTIIDENGLSTNYVFQSKKTVENNNGINLFQTVINKNEEELHVYSIVETEDEIEVILPINKEKKVFKFGENIARLFLYYPLIGSNNFGINFIVNCKNFLPTEPRDGVHLNSDKDQVQDQEAKNKEVISKSTQLIFDFLNSNVLEVPNPLLYTNVTFKTESDNQLLNEYFEELQIQWNEQLEKLPFVNTLEGYKTINEVIYFSEDFLTGDAETFSCFYELISKFYHVIPLENEVIMWSENAINWNSNSIDFIGHTDLLQKISECSLQDFDKDILKKYYQHLIDIEYTHVFNDYSLIPNIVGEFHKQGYFLKTENLNQEIIDLGKILVPEKVKQFIDNDFTFHFTISPFNQRQFSDEVKNELDKKDFKDIIYIGENLLIENYHTDMMDVKENIDADYFKAILNFCKLSYNIEANNKPIQLIKLIAKYYGLEENLIILPIVDEKERVELRSVRKVLFQIFFNLVSAHTNEWVKENTAFIYDIHKTYDDSSKEVFKLGHIYPNQLFELRLSECLRRDNGVLEDIKKIFKEIIGEDINEKLSLPDFNIFLPQEQTINNRYLTTIIEDKIFNGIVFNIEEHPNSPTILKIIPKLNDKDYQSLFPQLNDRKASIMISVVTNEDKKEDIFAIVTLEDDKLKSIGKLISNPNFETILNQAISLVEDETQGKANFQFKHKIGTHIETVLRHHLQSIYEPEEITYEVKEEQDGQDIVIKIKNEITYYIEVKSRWDKKTSIKMSKNQTLRAYKSFEIYSLCSVDMTNYFEDDRYEIQDIDKIVQFITFMPTIGKAVEHLAEVLEQTNEKEQIHLDGDYRTLVPQHIIEDNGITLTDFEHLLIEKIKAYAITN